MSELEAFAALAERLAEAVRPIVLAPFRSGIAFDIKADASPVTAADRAAEAAMRELIEDACPGHGILGEEHGAVRLDASHVWVLDPIDGTKSFVTGKPLFGTLIALLRDGRPVVGVIDMPALAERWVGINSRPTLFRRATGNGSTGNGHRCPRACLRRARPGLALRHLAAHVRRCGLPSPSNGCGPAATPPSTAPTSTPTGCWPTAGSTSSAKPR